MDLQDALTIVSLKLYVWPGTAYDEDASKKVAAQFKCSEDMTFLSKVLVEKKYLNDIMEATAEARTYFQENTYPWTDDGTRAKPNTEYLEFSNEMRERKHKWEAARDKLISDLPDAMDNAEKKLGKLFNKSDYPTEDDLKQMFTFEVETHDIDAAPHFMIDLWNQHDD